MNDDLIGVWLRAVDRVAPKDYAAVQGFDALPARVRGDSSLWSERFFTPAAAPAHQAQARRGYHLATAATPDLLRHEYKVDTLQLEVLESINFFIVRVATAPRILDAPPAQRAYIVRAAAAAILQMETAGHRWAFELPADLIEGSRFSSNQAADPLNLVSWESRIDGGILHGRLYFLCYKKFFDRADFRDIDDWFDNDFRMRPTPR